MGRGATSGHGEDKSCDMMMDTSESPRATSPVAPLVRSPSAPLVRSPSFPNNGSVPTPVLSGVGPLYEPIQKMRGIHVSMFGGSDVLKLRTDLIVPPLTPTQVLVRVMYTGINPVETYIREGQYSRLPDLPYIPGSDAAGYVEKVGSHVNGIVPGTKVFVTGFNSGSYAQYVVSDYHYVFPLHGRLTFAQGAAIGVPYFTVYKALIMGACTKPGENVLIHGASGAVGTAAVQIARSLGAIVVGTAGTKDGMDVVGKRLGLWRRIGSAGRQGFFAFVLCYGLCRWRSVFRLLDRLGHLWRRTPHVWRAQWYTRIGNRHRMLEALWALPRVDVWHLWMYRVVPN